MQLTCALRKTNVYVAMQVACILVFQLKNKLSLFKYFCDKRYYVSYKRVQLYIYNSKIQIISPLFSFIISMYPFIPIQTHNAVPKLRVEG